MKPARFLAAALVTLASLPLMAQQADVAAQQGISANAAGSTMNPTGPEEAKVSPAPVALASVKGAASPSFVVPRRLRLVNVELVGKLDAKSAKVGEPVVLKTQEPMRNTDGTEMPKGTRLVGYVISVQAHGKGIDDSEVAIQFDRAELKSGQSLAIYSVIRSVSPPATAGVIDSMHSGDNLGGGVMGGGMRTASGSGVERTGSGAAGASGGGTINTGGFIVGDGRAAERGGTEVDNVLQTPGQGAGPVTSDGGPEHGAGATAASRPHPTGVRGVMLAGDASGRISGTFSSTKQNVHLDGGTQMVLGVAAVQ